MRSWIDVGSIQDLTFEAPVDLLPSPYPIGAVDNGTFSFAVTVVPDDLFFELWERFEGPSLRILLEREYQENG